MARAVTPLFAGERVAAALLDLKPSEFRALVNAGLLPRARSIGCHERWDVEALHQIARGVAAFEDEMQW